MKKSGFSLRVAVSLVLCAVVWHQATASQSHQEQSPAKRASTVRLQEEPESAGEVVHERGLGNEWALKQLIGLNDEQIASIREEQENLEQAIGQLRRRLNEIRRGFEQALQSGDPATIGKAVQEEIVQRKQIDAERRAYLDRLESGLTPQQVERLDLIRNSILLSREEPAFLGPLMVEGLTLERDRRQPTGVREHQHRAPKGLPRSGGTSR
ncbi:MAG: hypothetical protein ACE15E_22140 [Acidobacteriota bacterium]